MIVDINGNPIRSGELTGEPQTARVGNLARQFAEHPSRGLTPAKLASILEDAEHGDLTAQSDLYADIEEKDGHVYAEMSKRRRALLTLPWDIAAPEDATAREEQAAQDVKAILDELDLDEILLNMADAIGYAYSEQEITWQRRDGDWLPRTIEHRPPRWFRIDPITQTIRLRDNSPDGELLRPGNWISHIHKARPGTLGRAGLHRTLAWPYLFKAYSLRDLAEFLEIYGLPARIGTYPNGASDKEKSTLLRAVVGVGHDAAGIIPEGMMIEFKEAAKGGKDPFEYMIDWCERTQSKAILGQTLTAQADGATSTNALGNVHMEVMRDLTVSDARQIEKTLTRDLIWMLTVLNSPITDPRRAPRFVFDTQEPEDLKLYAEALPQLVDIGMEIPVPWAHERLRIPAPDQGEAVLGRSASITVPPAAARASARAALTGDRQEPDLADDYATRMEAEAQAASEAMVNEIRALVAQATDLQDLQDRLRTAYAHMAPERMAAVMRLGFAAAELGGRFEGQEDV